MKKTAFGLLIITLLFTRNVNAQVPDTLSYLQQIVNNKTFFIGKPFSVLKDSLKINIRFFTLGYAHSYDKNKELATCLGFVFPETAEDFYLVYPMLYIAWQTPLNAVQSDELYRQNNGGGWSPQVYAFYANAIVADIEILEPE